MGCREVKLVAVASRKRLAAELGAVVPPEAPPSDSPSPLDETQRKILHAALEEFAEHGYDAASTSSIARLAGVAEKTLFARFRTKENLFRSTLNPVVLELFEPAIFESLRSTLTTPFERIDQFLAALMRNRIHLASRHPRKLKLLVQEFVLRPALFETFLATFRARIEPVLAGVVLHFQQSGQVRPLQRHVIMRMVIFLTAGHAISRFILRPGAEWSDDELDIMIDVLVNGLKPRP